MAFPMSVGVDTPRDDVSTSGINFFSVFRHLFLADLTNFNNFSFLSKYISLEYSVMINHGAVTNQKRRRVFVCTFRAESRLATTSNAFGLLALVDFLTKFLNAAASIL